MSFLSFFGRVLDPCTQPISSSQRRRRLALEALEDRVVPAVFNVNSLADILNPTGGIVTLRSAIQQANKTPGGNTINLTVAGTYFLTLQGTAGETDNAAGELSILASGGNLTINNTSGGQVDVSATGINRVFDINTPGGDANAKFLVTMQGFTIENGYATSTTNADGPGASGGGIRDQGFADLTLNNMDLSNNQAQADGGGISMENVVSEPWALTINNSTVSYNRAGDAGGGVETDGTGHVTITSSLIINNSAVNQGAGVWLDAINPGTVTQPVMTFAGTGYTTAPTVAFTGGGGTGAAGTALVSGGEVIGIVMTASGTGYTTAPTITFTGGGGTGATATTTVNQTFQSAGLAITGSTIDSNISIAANQFGGGVGNAGNGSVTITSSTLAGNFVNGNGGGFGDQNSVGALLLINDTIANNSSILDGGGVFENTTNTSTIEDSTITGNASQANAGGVEILNGNLVLDNTIVAQNQSGPANFLGGTAPDIFATVSTGKGNFIGIGDANLTGIANGQVSNQIGTLTNPLNPLLGPLESSGGLTQTRAPLPGSPVLQKGIPSIVPTTDPITGTALTDQRGLPRIVGGTVDIGADESQTVQPNVTMTSSMPTVTTTTTGGTTFLLTVTLTATVTATVGGTAAPTGTVTFFDGTVPLNSTPIPVNADGTATFAMTGLPAGVNVVGVQALTANYTPDTGGANNGWLPCGVNPTNLTVGTPAELVLNQLFQDMLTRAPNAGDLTYWVPQLGDQSTPSSQTAQQAVQKVALGITGSPEYMKCETDSLFTNYLNRAPNQSDLNYWISQFQGGMTMEQAATQISESQEFISKNGGTSDNTPNGIPSQQLITALFQCALGRTPQQQDFQSVQGQTMQQLVNNIFSSPEYEGHTVDVDYQDYVRRRANGTEANYWMTFFPGGSNAGMVPKGVQPDNYIISGFIGSQEYIQNAITDPTQTPVPANPLQASIT